MIGLLPLSYYHVNSIFSFIAEINVQTLYYFKERVVDGSTMPSTTRLSAQPYITDEEGLEPPGDHKGTAG